MVFRRRDPLSWGAWLREQVYPRSGFKRATRYVVYRMRRLPDQPHRVARGVFAGFFIGFLPLPGLQFVAAWGMARLMRGNVLAALLGTFNTNPLTTPPFTVFSVWLGHWILGIEAPLNAKYILTPLVEAYQKARAATAHERAERRAKMRAKLAEAAAKLKRRGEKGEDSDDDSQGSP